MAYFPNVAGARFFAEQVLPLVRRRVPDVALRLIGRSPHPSLRALAAADPAIVVTGAVADGAEHIAEGRVVVVPLRHGSGPRLKILEAWALDPGRRQRRRALLQQRRDRGQPASARSAACSSWMRGSITSSNASPPITCSSL